MDLYGKYLHTTGNNATGALFTHPGNQNLYLGAGKDQNGNKNEIILYNLSCDGGCHVPIFVASPINRIGII
ncbi:hypothetical protein [Flavivirga sp. 57AJ16]|uniref:hypothetical protein n=1 Tax=Flavivirga sp. 57AJ16 TaxID=3025307 RepID=UPI0023650890|nr:hypothetical protein [Flavivirga sp. 57AJ16]MDD7886016.1 hypothetical protein [Flavivirga sp. 57AJ16]